MFVVWNMDESGETGISLSQKYWSDERMQSMTDFVDEFEDIHKAISAANKASKSRGNDFDEELHRNEFREYL